jgi:hypothetical protein
MNPLYLLIALQVLDLLTTVIALRNPKLTEGNGILKPLFDKLGVLPTLLIMKGGFIGWLLYVRAEVPDWTLLLLCAVYLWIILNNIKLIRSH